MFTSRSRGQHACASVALALVTAFAAGPVSALPSHPIVAFFDAGEDSFPDRFTDIGFGEAVAIRNELGFIGSPRARDNGHVAVLNLTATGWQRVATLKAPNPLAQHDFGRVLTFRDGVLVVGGAKAAYIFKRSNGAFKLTQTLRPLAADDVGVFPVALRYQEGRLIASAFPSGKPGVVLVYELSSTGAFVRRATLKAGDGRADDGFGRDLSMTSRVVLVAGPGGAYIFRKNSSGAWIQAQKLEPVEPASGFGTAVAIDQGMILVGAPGEDLEGLPNGPPTPDGHVAGGAVYGFLPGQSGYIESFRLRPRSDEVFKYEGFGSDIEMSGSRIAIVATGQSTGISQFPGGLVVTYTRDGSSVLAHGIGNQTLLITAMGLSNRWVLVGAQANETCPLGCSGRAVIYDISRLEP
jgi:hypothetical protein